MPRSNQERSPMTSILFIIAVAVGVTAGLYFILWA